MQLIRCRVHLRNWQVVSLEEDGRRGDVVVSEDFRRWFSIEGLETVDAQDRVTLGVRRVGVRRLNILLLLQIFCTQLANLTLITDTKVLSDENKGK